MQEGGVKTEEDSGEKHKHHEESVLLETRNKWKEGRKIPAEAAVRPSFGARSSLGVLQPHCASPLPHTGDVKGRDSQAKEPPSNHKCLRPQREAGRRGGRVRCKSVSVTSRSHMNTRTSKTETPDRGSDT